MKKEGQGYPYYPIFLNIRGKRCVVVGGGRVAFRKVKTLLEHGADVEVISPNLCSGLKQLEEDKAIKVIYQNYKPGKIKGAFIVIAATDKKEVNQNVSQEAKKRGIIVNVVDAPELSDFIIPSSLYRGNLAIAISTAGVSPALAKKIRTKLEQNFGEEYASLTALIGEVRSELKKRGITLSGDSWQKALDLDLLLKLLQAGLREEAKVALLNNLERFKMNK